MADKYVTLDSLIEELNLKIVHMPEISGEKGENVRVESADVNRPGLPLIGYFDHFEQTRIQIIGITEYTYLQSFESKEIFEKISSIFETGIPAMIIANDEELNPLPEMIEAAKFYNTPLLSTSASTCSIMHSLIGSLSVSLAPKITLHGVLVEVYGEGVLLLGDSVIVKSETAIELIKRGHRLVADDAVEIKKVSNKTLVGSAPELIRYLIELRGIGIVDVRRIFGMGSVKDTENINLVVKMEPWNDSVTYDRLGMDENYHDILGNKCPCITIPIKPGRNLAVIIEVAAMNNKQRKLGYNAAREFDKKFADNFNTHIK